MIFKGIYFEPVKRLSFVHSFDSKVSVGLI